jgi:hypothetical protein
MKTTLCSAFYILVALALAACSTSSSPTASSNPAPEVPATTPTVIPPPVMAKPAPAAAPVVAAAAPDAGPTIDFDQQVKPFFQKYCYGCHDKDGRASGVGFDNKSDILQTLIPGDAENSSLYNVLYTRKMPQGRNKPTMEEVEMIREWIDQGAKVSNSIPLED